MSSGQVVEEIPNCYTERFSKMLTAARQGIEQIICEHFEKEGLSLVKEANSYKVYVFPCQADILVHEEYRVREKVIARLVVKFKYPDTIIARWNTGSKDILEL